ncbi:MAG: hypothetical protein WC564_04760 [Patescibacteria group bacterium]|jgi:hypothetical protein
MEENTVLDATLEIKVIQCKKTPKLLADFADVLISVPCPYDGVANTGDKHMKFVPEHYLKIEYPNDSQMIEVPGHYVRHDFFLPEEKRSAIARHFYVNKHSLGKKVVASVQILRNDNGSIAINIIETFINVINPATNEIVDIKLPDPQFRIAMRPLKEGEVESLKLFFVPGTKNCIEFVPLAKRVKD